MVAAHGLLRIFWPLDGPTGKEQGTIVGWKNSNLDVFVVAVLDIAEKSRVHGALQAGLLYRGNAYPMKQIFDICGGSSLKVLGTLNPAKAPIKFDSDDLALYTHGKGACPSISCPATTPISAQVVVYDRPSPHKMQYLSLQPMLLALDDCRAGLNMKSTILIADKEMGLEETDDIVAKQRLVEKLKQHTVKCHVSSQKEIMLPTILAQINCSAELDALMKKNISVLKSRAKRSLSVGEKVAESAVTAKDYLLLLVWEVATEYCWPVMKRIFILALLFQRLLAEIVLRILAWQIRPEGPALRDISATAQQLDIRLQQFCYWPLQYMTLRRRKQGWESITDRHPDYIRFYNSLWLVANDVIIGIAVGSYIIDHAELVAWKINSILDEWTIEGFVRMISWLMDWPAGLKLNNELAVFLGGVVLFMIEYWKGCVLSIQPLLPTIIYFIGFASFAGATMPIAMFSDLLSLLTCHIYCFYTAFARIFHAQLTIIISLFHLFRGKKYNILRNRIDSCDYDLDQLLLGTILFTLLTFLLPTVAVFYLTFTTARMAIIFLKASQDTLLACLNHFPLFALMLRIKDPRRLPGGISFALLTPPTNKTSLATIVHTPPSMLSNHHTAATPVPSSRDESSVSIPTSYIRLNSVPLPLRAMFDQYFQLGNRIRRHYLAPRVLLRLVTGRFLPPIDRKSMYSLQYSMLPSRRAGVIMLWQSLTSGTATAT